MKTPKAGPDYVSTTNSCRLCMPLGASLAFKGVEGAVPFLHGSQGCATYMRRFIISHFREPVDIASSSLGESQAVFGGGPNLKQGLVNVANKYGAKAIGIATTCLTETIGDDVPSLVREFLKEAKVESPGGQLPALIPVSTPAYGGSHMAGFHAAVTAIVKELAGPTEKHQGVNLFPGFVSPADLRVLLGIMDDFGLDATLLPDYSRTLDAPALDHYEVLPAGGTPLARIRAMGGSRASLELGRCLPDATAGLNLREKFGVPLLSLGLPVGLRETDAFFAALAELSGRDVPDKHRDERGRLVDAMVDGHKYLSGKTAFVYGDEDLAVGLTSWLTELGVKPLLVASGGGGGKLSVGVGELTAGILKDEPVVEDATDFYELAEQAREMKPDFLIGNSKGYKIASELGIPLVRAGFPIHDRFGGQRLRHLSYQGAQELMDRIVNALLAHRQDEAGMGWGYL